MSLAALATAGTILAFLACGTNAVGIQDCRDIENARCQAAPSCSDAGFDLAYPLHEGTDVDSCIRFYKDQCLHGLVTSVLPGNAQVNACVAAIKSGDCAIVAAPQNFPACSFLVPVVTTTDAGEDAGDASYDASLDAADASDAGDASD